MTVRQRTFCILSFAASLASACIEPDESADIESVEQQVTQTKLAKALEQRARISANIPSRAIPPRAIGIAATDPASLVASLDISPNLQPTFVSIDRPPVTDGGDEAALTTPRFGAILPRKGPEFLLLSTGRTGNAAIRSERGWDFGAQNSEAGDVVTLRLRVTVPRGFNRMSFDYTFLSAESPEYVGTQFNDAFTARVSDALGANRVVAEASVNSVEFHPVSTTNVGLTPFLFYVDDPFGVNEAPGDTGFEIDAGTTDFQTVNAEVSSGQVIVEFDIRDVGDGILDSAIIIDNVAFSAMEVIDPRDALMISELDGAVLRTPNQRLISPSRPVTAVAADGATQVLLRSNVPSGGRATFSVISGSAADGSLNPNNGSAAWTNTVTVDAVLIAGQWYAFALYRGPDDFERTPADNLLATREAELSMQFAPVLGDAFGQDLAVTLVRPPVVVVPEMWSNSESDLLCEGWTAPNSLMDKANPPAVPHPFTVSCAEYGLSSVRGFEANRGIVADAISAALERERAKGAAVTRADVVAHGLGGLLARRYRDERGFLHYNNFYAGTINRLITMNTPHLGARMADEIVNFREYAKQRGTAVWNGLKATLEQSGVFIETANGEVAVDELKTRSAFIDGIGTGGELSREMFYHALVSGGGRPIVAQNARGLLTSAARILYSQVEFNHPLSTGTTSQKRNFILGPGDVTAPNQTRIFCNNTLFTADDDHDLFSTTWEQRGGLDDDFVTPMAVAIGSDQSGHFNLSRSRAHTQEVVKLLNSPVRGGSFATAMSSPAATARRNGCPLVWPAVAPGASRFALAMVDQSVSVTTPGPGTTVRPGDAITVTVEAGDTPEAVMVVAAGQLLFFEERPYTGTLVVPRNAIGTIEIRTIAFYPDGGISFGAPVPLNVEVPTTLVALEVLNGNAVLSRPGSRQQIAVVGTYSDGARRNLTAASRGTIYRVSSLLSVVNISPDGVLTAIGPGEATLTVANATNRPDGRPVLTSINVHVGEPSCGDAVQDPGEICDDGNTQGGDGCDGLCRKENLPPQAICESPTPCSDPGLCSAAVTDLGAGSTDPNGDETLAITQSPPGPYAVGRHTVSVSVSDGEFTAECVSDVDVLDCEQPSIQCPAAATLECTGDGGATITPGTAIAADNCGVTVQSPPGGLLPVGRNELAYTATDPSGNQARCTRTVDVIDTRPPTVTAQEVALWPPDRRYQTIELADCIDVVDECSGRLLPGQYQAQVTCVTSDEPDNAPGGADGNSVNDIVIVDRDTVRVRSERNDFLDGRVYKIHFRVQDPSGNLREGVCPVLVPDDRPCGVPGHECEAEDSGVAHQVCAP